METAIPGKIVNPRGGFEENDRRLRSRRRLSSHAFGDACNFAMIESADDSALDALFEEFVEHNLAPQSYQQISRRSCLRYV